MIKFFFLCHTAGVCEWVLTYQIEIRKSKVFVWAECCHLLVMTNGIDTSDKWSSVADLPKLIGALGRKPQRSDLESKVTRSLFWSHINMFTGSTKERSWKNQLSRYYKEMFGKSDGKARFWHGYRNHWNYPTFILVCANHARLCSSDLGLSPVLCFSQLYRSEEHTVWTPVTL